MCSDVASELLRGLESSCAFYPVRLTLLFTPTLAFPATPGLRFDMVMRCEAMRLLRTVRGPLISDFLTKKGEEDADKVGSFAHAHPQFRAVRLSTPSAELTNRNGR
jgi:hypothetical protein